MECIKVKRLLFMSFCLGFVSTVVSAWALSVFGTKDDTFRFVMVRSDGGLYSASRNEAWGTQSFEWRDVSQQRNMNSPESVEMIETFGTFVDPPTWSVVRVRSAAIAIQHEAIRSAGRGDLEVSVVEIAAGWPALALVARLHSVSSVDLHVPPTPRRCQGGILLDWWRRGRGYPSVVPFVPIWPGLLLNTACLSGFWSILLLGIPFVQSKRRLAMGRCRRCGYLCAGLPSNAVCPECGWGLKS